MTQKTTDEIRTLLRNAKLDFESVENRALNDYLPKIFHSCPFTEEICTTKQCQECVEFKKLRKQAKFFVQIPKKIQHRPWSNG